MPASARRTWVWVLLSVITFGGLGMGAYLSFHWPFTRAAITQSLEDKFKRQVVIESFRETWFPPGCIAGDISFLHRRRMNLPPLFTARNLVIQTTWPALLGRHITKVKIIGLRMTVPPTNRSGVSPVMPVSDPKAKSQVASVGEIEANDAIIVFLPRQTDAPVITMRVHQLVIDHIGATTPIEFHGSLQTDKPPGELTAIGKLGPWNQDDVAATPLSGQYRFSNADLKVFHGLRGLITAQGNFNGNLSGIGVNGNFDVPGFHVDGSAHSAKLTGQFRASVDTHTADTTLEAIQGTVGKTTILASGNVSGGKGSEGKTARVQLTVKTGRVEDLLNYFSDEKQPSMTGAVRLQAYTEIPPGEGFLGKIRLNGEFGITEGRFTNPSRQAPVDHLSESSKGEKKAQQNEDPRTVLSELKGHVVIQGGTAALSNVSFDVPGATAAIVGNYNLLEKTVDLRGTLRTDGALSDTSSGIKAVLLKVATPFFKKQHMTVVPFTITGRASQPKMELDWRRALK